MEFAVAFPCQPARLVEVEIRVTILSISLGELMQMRVRPAHDTLNDVVELAQMNVAGHHDTTPDLWFDVEQTDLEFVHLAHIAVPVSLTDR